MDQDKQSRPDIAGVLGEELRDARLDEKRPAFIRPLTLALLYAFLGILWILLTDLLVEWLFAERTSYALAQVIKGIVYIGTTAVFIYWLARRASRALQDQLAQERLATSEKLLSAILASLGEAVLIIDPRNNSILRCNPATEEMFGYSEEELLGQSTGLLHVDEASYEEFANTGEAVLAQGKTFKTEFRMKRKDGRIIDTYNVVGPVHEDLGWEAGVISVIWDCSERKEAERALLQQEEQYRLLAENTLDVIWSMTMDLEFTYVNPAIENQLGCRREEFVGTNLKAYCSKGEFQRIAKVIENEIAEHGTERGVLIETELIHRDGSPVPVEVHATVLYDEQGRPAGIQGSTRDIWERKKAQRLEAQLRQSQRLEALGTFASGVAHEINNPIMGITGYADLIAEEAPQDAPLLIQTATEIKRETGRIQTLVRNLLSFARHEEKKEPVPAQLDSIVADTLSLIRTVMRHDAITLEVDIPNDLPPVYCRPQQVQQVVMNLLTNARDAVNSKYPESHENKQIQVCGEAFQKGGRDWLRLTVEDHGPGMPEEIRERIFDPFYTTKPEGSGTGLGMSVVHGIVTEHGGAISVESEPGESTRVHVDLPVSGKESG